MIIFKMQEIKPIALRKLGDEASNQLYLDYEIHGHDGGIAKFTCYLDTLDDETLEKVCIYFNITYPRII